MNLVLGKEEGVIKDSRFTTNLLLAWLKTNFTLTSKRIVGYKPNTLLGAIPLGKTEVTYPIKSVASVGVSTKFHLSRFLLGGLLAAAGFLSVADSLGIGILLVLLGAVPLFNCFTSTLNISNNAGQVHHIEISILEKDKVQEFATTVNTTIAESA